MASQIQLIFLLVIVGLVYGELNTLRSNDDDEERKVILNKKIDALLPKIRKFIINEGLDPTEVPDFSESILPELQGKLKGDVTFTQGWLQNLSKIKRTREVIGTYKKKVLTLEINLGFEVLDCSYKYYLKHLLHKRRGDVYARFFDLDVKIVVKIDLSKHRKRLIQLKSIKFSHVRKYDIKFEGNLLDPILNKLTKIIAKVFKNRVLKGIEDRAMKIFGTKIDEWNSEQFLRLNNFTSVEEMFDDWNTQLY